MTLLSLYFLLLTGTIAQGQTLIAKWTFPTGTAADSLADGGLPVNLARSLHTDGGTSVIDFSKNGATTKAAQATGWDNGAMTKCWVVSVNTAGYQDLKISSKQQSGGNNPGPGEYMVQFKTGFSDWADVPNSTMITANNWTSAALDSIPLPDSCNNKDFLYLRWVMTTNTNSSGSPVISSGINKIDDIYITGKQISTAVNELAEAVIFSVWPNPSHGLINVKSTGMIRSIELLDMHGRLICSEEGVCGHVATMNAGFAKKGNCFLRIHTSSGESSTKPVTLF